MVSTLWKQHSAPIWGLSQTYWNLLTNEKMLTMKTCCHVFSQCLTTQLKKKTVLLNNRLYIWSFSEQNVPVTQTWNIAFFGILS